MVGTVIGAVISSKASKDAASTQANAANNASAVQKEMYDQTRRDQLPFLNTGISANRQLAYLMGLTPTDINAEEGKSAPGGALPGGTPPSPTGGPGGMYAPPVPGASTAPATSGYDPSIPKTFLPAVDPNSINSSFGVPTWQVVNAMAKLGYGATGRTDAAWAAIQKNPAQLAQLKQLISSGQTKPWTAAAPTTPNVNTTLGLTPEQITANGTQGAYGSLSKPFGMADFQADPGYDFRMSEGQKALERSAAAKGGLNSGAQMKAITRFGQDTASNEFGNAYNRYNTNQTNLFNRLSSLSGGGQTSAGTLATTGQNTANQISNNITSGGAATAAGQVGSANAWSTGLNNIARGFTQPGYGSYGSAGPYNPEAAANGLPWSDIQLKDDITPVGQQNGHNIYEFSYKGSPLRYRGVIAQEVQKTHPEAVYMRKGFLCVDYSALGLKMEGVPWH